MQNNNWYSVKNQSLAVYTRNAGFDLAIYDQYSLKIKEELRKKAIKNALIEIKNECQYQGFNISDVKEGVYVISLSNPLSLKYRHARSQVIYIGMGNITKRIESHFNHSLFDFMESLSGANFDFYFAKPARPGPNKQYYKHVEHCMLEYFCEQYGGMDGLRRFPILNKNAGANKGIGPDNEWWKEPLKPSKKAKPLWELSPTDFSNFPPLDSSD